MSASYDEHVGELKATSTDPSWAETSETYERQLCVHPVTIYIAGFLTCMTEHEVTVDMQHYRVVNCTT
jgi:hypothetical protein